MSSTAHTAHDVMTLLEIKEIAHYGLRDAFRAFRETWEKLDPRDADNFAFDFQRQWSRFESVAAIANAEIETARIVALRLAQYPAETAWRLVSTVDSVEPGRVSRGDFIDLAARLLVAARAANFPMSVPANVLIGLPNVRAEFGAEAATQVDTPPFGATDPAEAPPTSDDGAVDAQTPPAGTLNPTLDRLIAAVGKLPRLPFKQQVALAVAVTASIALVGGIVGRLIAKRQPKPATA